MFRILGLSLIVMIADASAAQSINVAGKVINKNGKGVIGAIVALAGKKLSDTTDGQGAFSLTSVTFTANPAPLIPAAEKNFIAGGNVVLNLTRPGRVAIELFDLRGNLLAKVLDYTTSAGSFRFTISAHPLAENIKLIRVSVGRYSSTFRYLSINKGTDAYSSTSSFSTSESGRLAKIAATVDTLKITAAGYVSHDTAISSYQTVVTVTVDSMTLGKFSFFVTSLEGLQSLSGSDKGFGGDLRFGKTGQGAGLLGADSICECLAEKSLPGSKIKKWRAFLSVEKDLNGKQVNAIDRIGTGPWYDRLGRVMSNTVSDLLHERPNADAAIKNDLPNEYGVPNHRPDPNKAAVDNHQFITGSDSLGKLYKSTSSSNSTCQDWTSSAADGGKPASGLSWPKSGGGFARVTAGSMPRNVQSWIFVWQLWGCEAGTDLTEASMKGKEGVYTIGNGGGYGGFYCFALTP